MTPARALPLVLPLLAGALLAGAARADTPPGVWDVARDPEARARWNLHVHVRRLMRPPSSEDAFSPELKRDEELRFEAARAMLEEAGAASSPDVRLRFDLGVVLQELASIEGRRADLSRQAVAILAPAVDTAPDHPAASEALEALVNAYTFLDRPREELATWRRFIAHLPDDASKVLPLMNMGEAEMRLGYVEVAVGTFKSVLEICGSLPNSSSHNFVYALTLWDLAVALDRSGDPRGALDTGERAQKLRWAESGPAGLVHEVTGWDAINDKRTVYFIPSWERDWYLALGSAASARGERDPRAAAELWAQAETHWDTYVAGAAASRGDDRFVAIARARRERVHAQRVAADARAAKAGISSAKDEVNGEEHAL